MDGHGHIWTNIMINVSKLISIFTISVFSLFALFLIVKIYNIFV